MYRSTISLPKNQLRPAEQISMAAGAVIGLAGIALQFYFMLQFTYISKLEAVIRFFSFFTILTNMGVVLGYACPLLTAQSVAGRFLSSASARAATLVYIVMVGAVYNLFLRQLYHPLGWAKLADILVHDVAPVFYLVFWLTFGAKTDLRWSDAGRWLLFPLAYLGYSLARGALVHYYPYPFIDVTVSGYSRVLINATGFTAVFWGLGLIVIALARAMTSISPQTSQPDLA